MRGLVVRVRSRRHLEPVHRPRAEPRVPRPGGTRVVGVVCGGSPSTSVICWIEAGPSTIRARVCCHTASCSTSRWSNCSATATVTCAGRPCRSGTWRWVMGSGPPSATARCASTLGWSSRIHSGRRVSSGAGRPASRARWVAMSRRSVSCAAHSRVATAPTGPHSTARTPARPDRQAYSPLPPPSTIRTSPPCRRACRARERIRVEVPLPGWPTASRCGSVERGPVRQTTGGTSRGCSPSSTGRVRCTLPESVKPSTLSPGEVTNGWAAMPVGSAASTLRSSWLPSSSQSKRYSRPRPDLACSSASIRAREAASPSVK